jgi:5-hydroxyisourate hydrolase-like protein (transthyretin family)
MKRFVAAALLFTLAAAAQTGAPPPSRVEIRGVVVEPGTNAPVADAEISLFVQAGGAVRINGGWKPDESRKARTDYRGAFAMRLDTPGEYRVEPRKTGYLAGTPDGADVKLTGEKPSAEVRLFLVRPGRLTGTIVDDDTGKPAANLRLHAVQPRRSGWLPPVEGSEVKTDAEGKFVMANLPPGDYAVEIGLQTDDQQRILTKFTEEDVKAVVPDYEHTFWPGGHGQDSVLPVTLTSGASVNLGVLGVRKVPYYRVHVRATGADCSGGDPVSVSELLQISESRLHHLLGRTECGGDLLVTGFAPGSYRLLLNTGRRETWRTASVPFSIADKNLELVASFRSDVTVSGAFTAADGGKLPDLGKVRIGLRGVDTNGSLGDPAVPDSDGRFRLEHVRLVSGMVLVMGLGPPHYVKEVRYNGLLLEGGIVPLDQGALTHSLTVVVDDKSGSIVGTVMSGDQPAGGALVVAVKWPPNFERMLSGLGHAKADGSGKFQVSGLPPGEYRVIAVKNLPPPEIGNRTFERALAEGTKVEIGPNGIQSVTLKVTELQ